MVPDAKVTEFLEANPSDDSDASSSSSDDGGPKGGKDSFPSGRARRDDPPLVVSLDAVARKRLWLAGRAYSLFNALAEDTCILVFEGLSQHEVFRAAAACRALHAASSAPRLFRHLDLHAVGRDVSRNGRIRWLGPEAMVAAVEGFLRQPRFAQVQRLDVRGLYLGRGKPEDNTLLQQVACCCPDVRHLELGDAEPKALWSDLARYMPLALARSLRKWWPARPLSVEAYGRRYEIA